MAAQGQAATEAGMQVLTRGPVHEAFAVASMTGATAGVVITKAPYDPITELPPDQRPEGTNVAWIPGYWSWDDDRTDFIWVSGVWRDLPPGRQWVPGYWTPVKGGSQWISGFWGDATQTEVDYLPPPPEPLEAGPSSPAPAPGNLWTPGCWVWQQTRYDWQPGYWVVQQPDWVWAPAHYTWTPRGHVYVPGYWDHDIAHRGVMFAPVYYDQPVYARPSYSYSPSIVIDLGVIAACLFVQPRSHHYYFGDYYDHRYEERGFYPWYSKQVTRYGDDPLYVHYRSTQLQQDPDWDVHVDEQFRHRRDNVDARPPQTLALQVNIMKARQAGAPENVIIGQSFAEAAQSKSRPQRFTSINMDERKQIETRGREVRTFQLERAKIETAPQAAKKSRGARETLQPVRMQLPVSPVAARSAEAVEGAKAPPSMPVAPKPQAAEGRARQVKPQKAETKTAAPQVQEKPGKAAVRPSPANEKPKRVEPKPETIKPASTSQNTEAKPSPTKERSQRVQSRPETAKPESTPQKNETKPSSGNEKPQRVAPKPETTKSESTPQRLAPKPEPSKRERVPVKTESKSRAPQAVETTRPQKVEARPEAKPKQPQVQSRPKTVEPKREAPKPEVRSPKPEAQAQPSRADTKKQKGKQKQAPGTEDNKNKKSDEK